MVKEVIVIGFVEEAQKLERQLTTVVNSLEAVLFVGIDGLCKTTLAKKVYNDLAIKGHFSSRVWKPINKSSKVDEQPTIDQICACLKEQRYLFVSNNLWTTDAWNDLKVALPNQSCGIKILLTIRNTEVVLLAKPDTPTPSFKYA
ncbi:putative disease resistance protein At1g50180 [Bidens hawaiensis]|uniref:putative disease resistance protein At1g50180 n=1 Tax=Bidens hawaiensis TaxID=980011 RepID=UPI00404B7400